MFSLQGISVADWARRAALVAGAAGLIVSGTAFAQQTSNGGLPNAADRLESPFFIPVSDDAAYETPLEKPADVLPMPAPAAEAPAAEEPWSLMGLHTNADGTNHFKDNGWQFGGWTQFGYSNNPDAAFTGNSVFLNQRYEWDRLNLNQQWLYLGRAADGSKGLDGGFRLDFIYGVDGNDTQAFGNPPGRYDYLNGWDHGMYEFALPQAYTEIAVGNTTVKLGHFFTLLGYEVVPSNGNFFFSRQMTWYNSEPFTHTGVLAATKVNDQLTVHNGWVLGWDSGFSQFNQANAYHGGMVYQLSEKTALTYMLVGGNMGWRGDGACNAWVLSHNWTDKLTTVHQFDVFNSNLDNAAGVPTNFATDGIAGDSTSLLNYAFYQINDKLKAGIRQEWYKADSVSYNAITYGVNVKPVSNLALLIRPEVRHMWAPGNEMKYGNNEDLFNETVFGIDAILTY